MRLAGLLLAPILLAATPAFAETCIPGPPPANNPVMLALPDSYWYELPAWSDLPRGERDLLARVSIAQRNGRALNPGLVFSDREPPDVVALATAPDQFFVAEGASRLDALVRDALAYLHMRDANSTFYVSNGFRSYAAQLETWPKNLRKYLDRIRDQLHPDSSGHYSDDDVCTLRAYAATRYAFPGFSHHQSGRAADFHSRLGDTPELNSDSGGDNIPRWCASEIFAWLHRNARRYGFAQEKIDEPWHWVYEPNLAPHSAAADYVATSCQSVVR